MQATRFWVPACLAVFASALSLDCGSDEAAAPPRKPCVACIDDPIGGEGFGGGPSFGVGGSGGSAEAPVGGDRATPGGGTTGATAGTAGNGAEGGAAGSNEGGSSSGGAPPTPGAEQLELCGRLSMVVPHADAVARAYAKALYADCQVSWLIPKQEADLIAFRNQLPTWSYDFWGCVGAPPVDSFGLVFGTPSLTQADVEVLIGHYMSIAQDELSLSPLEADEMRAAMERLAAPLVTDPSPDVSNSQCGGGGGAGAGGAAP
jgi:hypothetical protein